MKMSEGNEGGRTAPPSHLDRAGAGGVADGMRHEWMWCKQATLLRLFPGLVEEQAQPVQRVLADVAALEVIGERGKEPSVDPRSRTIFTIKLDTDVGVMELAQLQETGERL